MRVFFSAGEASGDAYAAEILKRLQPESLGYFRDKLAAFRHEMGIASNKELFEALSGESLGADSLDLVELVMAFEEEMGVSIPGEFTHGDRTHELVTYISERLSVESLATDIAFQAVGGKRLAEAGARIVADSSKWGAVGIYESIKVSPRVIGGYLKAKRELKRGRPGLFVPIDFGFMNVKLARYAKERGWKVLYFVPPGSWRRDRQGADLPAVTDAIVTPFPWSAQILNEMGANAHYFGHPLKEMVALAQDAPAREGIAVLPGSRAHEIAQNVPVIALAIKDVPGPVTIAVAPNADEAALRREWLKWSDHSPRFVRRAAEALKASRAAVVCSGTATLEAALCHCPCVVVYRGSRVMELEYRLRKPKFDYVSLPNILLGRPLLKELLQDAATPQAVGDELRALLTEGPRRTEVLGAFLDLDAAMGETDCLERTAGLAREMLAEDQGPGPGTERRSGVLQTPASSQSE
jgi:lipid-A-disaccharide synthase